MGQSVMIQVIQVILNDGSALASLPLLRSVDGLDDRLRKYNECDKDVV
jgi:hypothetical protein